MGGGEVGAAVGVTRGVEAVVVAGTRVGGVVAVATRGAGDGEVGVGAADTRVEEEAGIPVAEEAVGEGVTGEGTDFFYVARYLAARAC